VMSTTHLHLTPRLEMNGACIYVMKLLKYIMYIFTVFCPLMSYDWYLLPYWYTLYIHGVHYSVVQKWITVCKGNVIIVADFWLEYFSVQWICNDTNINSSSYTRWQSPLFEIVQKWCQDLYSKKGSDCEV
jgi:hypothetical protein